MLNFHLMSTSWFRSYWTGASISKAAKADDRQMSIHDISLKCHRFPTFLFHNHVENTLWCVLKALVLIQSRKRRKLVETVIKSTQPLAHFPKAKSRGNVFSFEPKAKCQTKTKCFHRRLVAHHPKQFPLPQRPQQLYKTLETTIFSWISTMLQQILVSAPLSM